MNNQSFDVVCYLKVTDYSMLIRRMTITANDWIEVVKIARENTIDALTYAGFKGISGIYFSVDRVEIFNADYPEHAFS